MIERKENLTEEQRMDYIVLDMEWNQPWPGSPSSKKPAGSAIRGEIIQVGAVRVLEDGTVADEFQVMVRPKVYRHLNRRVSKLTGIKETRLREEGIPFPGNACWLYSTLMARAARSSGRVRPNCASTVGFT